MVRVLIRRVGGGMEPPRGERPPRPLYFTILIIYPLSATAENNTAT